MSSLHNISAIFRSPEAAVLASQAVQAGDLAARQGQAKLQSDAARRETQVQAQSESQASASVGPRQQAPEQEQRRRRAKATALEAEALPGPGGSRRLDIVA